MENPIYISLYDEVKNAIGDVPILMATKATLVHTSHTLEDVIFREKLPAYMFTGFQQSSYWATETKRYRELATITKQICIFAGDPIPDDFEGKIAQVTLKGDDPLLQEWFVVILSESFSVLLTGKDQLGAYDDDNDRLFETILNFSPGVINKALDKLEDILAQYRPEIGEELRQVRQQYPVPHTNYDYITQIMTEILTYEEYLQDALRAKEHRQRHIAAALRTERNYQSQLINQSPAYIMTMSVDGLIFMMNDVLEVVLGIKESTDNLTDNQDATSELPDTMRLTSARANIDFIRQYVVPDDRIIFIQAITSALNTGHHYTFDAQILGKDDQIVPVEWQLRLVKNEQDVMHILALGYDLTQRLWLEELQLERRNLELSLMAERELNSLRSQFIRTVSHEFRTPLSIILSSTELIEKYYDSLAPDSRQKRLNNIRQQVLHMVNMLNDVTLIESLQQDQVEITLKVTHLYVFVRDIIVITQESFLAPPRKINFISDMHSFALIQADQRILSQILQNLLINAIHYSEDDIECHLNAHDEAIIIEVIDTGIGIPESTLKHMFEPFYRSKQVDHIMGTGLGLTIVKNYVALHQGTIDVQSAPNVGTKMTITLPYETLSDGLLSFKYKSLADSP